MANYLHHLFLLLLQLRQTPTTTAALISIEYLYPNFTGSTLNFIDKSGIFLTSSSSTFSAIFSSPSPQSPFTFSIIHSPTSTPIWSANPNSPAPYTSYLSLSSSSLSLSLSNSSLLWSTPSLPRPISALQLLNSGNLLLLDSSNSSLWESFHHPTDTLLSSQHLPAGSSLSTPDGDHQLQITDRDALLLWTTNVTQQPQQYWRLSSDPRWVKDLNDPVAYMAVNDAGVFLFSAGNRALYVLALSTTVAIRFVRLDSGGRLRVLGYSGNGSVLSEDVVVPSGACDLPMSCDKLEVCTMQNRDASCNCPALFAPAKDGGCLPADGSDLVSSSNCNSTTDSSLEISYKSIGSQVDYFANKFASPEVTNGNFTSCRDLCSSTCSCLGFFYHNSFRTCFLIKNQIGSLVSNNNQGVFNSGDGYIKVLGLRQQDRDSDKNPNLIQILLSSIAGLLFILLLFTAIYYWRRRQWINKENNKLAPLTEIYFGPNKPFSPLANTDRDSSTDIFSSGDNQTSGELLIPGLPTRFTFAELVAATNNFGTKIGAGGFGEVFYGELPDKTAVAVKRIIAGLGSIQGKKEFCAEIAVIGRIHHVNLVRLRGFCAEGRRRRRRQHFLVYEYMSRGSLERSLFNPTGPVLEWGDRMKIAIGAAKGLAYLHSGCDPKIVHCDVKPENILLDDAGGVKISDFGLSKLLAPERSGLFFTTMRGTRGYLAPEWLANSTISERADVYSYGMVLLEIIRGRKNYMEEGEGWSSGGSPGGTEYFPTTALEMHERGSYLGLEDPRLEGRVVEEEVGRAVRVALCCLHEDPALRPRMAAVAEMLDGAMEEARPRAEALTFFRMFGKGYVDSGTSSGSGNRSSTTGMVSWSDILITRQRMAAGGGGKVFNSLR